MYGLLVKYQRVQGRFCFGVTGRINVKLWCLSTRIHRVKSHSSNPREPKLSFSYTFCTSLAITSEKLPKVSTALRAKFKSNKIKQGERKEV